MAHITAINTIASNQKKANPAKLVLQKKHEEKMMFFYLPASSQRSIIPGKLEAHIIALLDNALS